MGNAEDLIFRSAALKSLGEPPPVWQESDYEIGMQVQWTSDFNAIKNVPPARSDVPDTNVGDMISRQAAINEVKEAYENDEMLDGYEYRLQELPPAQPQYEELTNELTETHACDLISRQAAIDKITEYGSGNVTCMSVGELKRRIEQLPSAKPEPQWIPCSERLPEVDEELESASVLITYKNTYWTGATTTNVAIARYGEKLLSSDGKYLDTPGWVGSKRYSVDDVFAWMPMPEPYAERREE